MKISVKIKSFFQLVFPSGWAEWGVFVLYMILYTSIASYMAFEYRIVFDDRIPWDAYFSFDNRAIILTGGGFERHPLANYCFDVLRNCALFFSEGNKNEIFRLVLSLCSAITVSMSMVILYKYLRNIIRLPIYIAFSLIFFFGFFTTPLLLSFTPETYTYTLFLLILFQYYIAIKLRENQEVPFLALTLAGVSVGGLTITNIAKIYLPLLFENGVFRNWKKSLNLFLRTIFSISVFVILYLNRLNFDLQTIIKKTGTQYEKFSQPKVTPIWDMIYSWFFGGNMLFPSFIIRDYHNKNSFYYKALFMDVYSSWLLYLVVGMFFLLVFWGYIRLFKNKFVQIIILSFLVDILIHVVLKFGLSTSYIYGGHFIFVVPMMLGWLLFSYRKHPKVLSFLLVLISVLAIYLLMNNTYRAYEFWVFLETYYRA